MLKISLAVRNYNTNNLLKTLDKLQIGHWPSRGNDSLFALGLQNFRELFAIKQTLTQATFWFRQKASCK